MINTGKLDAIVRAKFLPTLKQNLYTRVPLFERLFKPTAIIFEGGRVRYFMPLKDELTAGVYYHAKCGDYVILSELIKRDDEESKKALAKIATWRLLNPEEAERFSQITHSKDNP